MAVRVNASVNFEAKDRAEAEALLDGWQLHEGCQVFVTVSDALHQMEAVADGRLAPVPEPEPPPEPPLAPPEAEAAELQTPEA
jgi:hypothetical protein